jgi:hypothetical protein
MGVTMGSPCAHGVLGTAHEEVGDTTGNMVLGDSYMVIKGGNVGPHVSVPPPPSHLDVCKPICVIEFDNIHLENLLK